MKRKRRSWELPTNHFRQTFKFACHCEARQRRGNPSFFSTFLCFAKEKLQKQTRPKENLWNSVGQQDYTAQEPYPRIVFTFPPPMQRLSLSLLPTHAHLYGSCGANFSEKFPCHSERSEESRFFRGFFVALLLRMTIGAGAARKTKHTTQR